MMARGGNLGMTAPAKMASRSILSGLKQSALRYINNKLLVFVKQM
jgi:hypothetical protein